MASFYRRRPTRAVFVGQIGIGGLNPIRIQSMTTSDTKDTESVVREIGELSAAGCEIVRLTVPTQADCDNLPNIRREMTKRGLKVPLVADIHFTPTVAMKVVDYVEKVRINPGNFADKKLFKTFEIKDDDYAAELARIEDKFGPLVLKCKERGVAMRIGTNHGSLSDRIMNRYGDTPEGMVESALEFLRIAAKLNYHDIVLSMKASNPQVMVTAYRLLVKRMASENMDYPLHLGVTEAGVGEDARIKSAVGIGALLEEGIGDTVRVSLTEDSIHEIPVAGALIAPYNQKFYFSRFHDAAYDAGKTDPLPAHLAFLRHDDFPMAYERRPSRQCGAKDLTFGGSGTVRVWTDLGLGLDAILKANAGELRFEGVEMTRETYSVETARHLAAQGLVTGLISDDVHFLANAQGIGKAVFIVSKPENLDPLAATCAKFGSHLELCFDASSKLISSPGFQDALEAIAQTLKQVGFHNFSFSLSSDADHHDYRILARAMDAEGIHQPIHLRYAVNDRPTILNAATQLGSLLIDGTGDSIQIDGSKDAVFSLNLSYGILQAARVRISKTEFIACPSCGRTQFNLQDVTARIKARTAHLKGLKIAIMGCIVNGPGEMADADFGYVGTGTGKISLYVGKDCVERNIPEAGALDNLVALIRSHGKWVEQSV